MFVVVGEGVKGFESAGVMPNVLAEFIVALRGYDKGEAMLPISCCFIGIVAERVCRLVIVCPSSWLELGIVHFFKGFSPAAIVLTAGIELLGIILLFKFIEEYVS